jgi:hypothetical protein
MRTLLTTTPRNPTYTESEDMQNNSNAYICSPPFINAIFTLQINPGNVNKNNTPKIKKTTSKHDNPVNENRINTSKANMLIG